MKVMSFGAGVQSTTMLLMSLTGEIERADCAVFADTGWEPRRTYEHLEGTLQLCTKHGMPLYTVSAGNLRQDVLTRISNGDGGCRVAQPPLYVINRNGKEGMPPNTGGSLWRQCTQEYKIEPIRAKIRELLGVPKGKRVKTKVELWKGISLDEAHRMKDSRDAWIVNRYPLIDRKMTRDDCVCWLKSHGYFVPPKSACVGCPFHANGYWIEQMKNRPDEFADAEQFDAALRERPYPGVTGQVYVHRRMLPLREAVLSTMGDPNQGDLFGQECDGVCGV